MSGKGDLTMSFSSSVIPICNQPILAMNKVTRRIMNLIFLATCFCMVQGCYQYRVSTSNFDPSTPYRSKTVNSFFWGLAQPSNNGVTVVAYDCDKLKLNSLDEVTVCNNFGYSVITVATLGIWCPMKVKWKCPKPCPREGQ
jgi:hypothetical protein